MTATPTTPSSESLAGRYGWLLSAVWLVFLVFPLLAILGDDDSGTVTKVASTVLLVAFAAIYVDGFRHLHRRQQRALVDHRGTGSRWIGGDRAGLAHFAALVALSLAIGLVAGVATIGVVTFIVAFAVFHFSWPMVWATFATGLAVTALVPVAVGRFGDLWSLSMILAAVGGAAVLVRVVESHQFDQAHLRTSLALSDERSRVARDVHDVLGHSLTAVVLKVELCQRLLDEVDAAAATDDQRIEACRGHLAELDSIGRSALAEIRSTVGGLRATDLADEVTVARTVLADAGIDLLVTGDVADVANGQRPVLAWVVREAITNVVRHARAERCHIELAPAGPVLLRVTDDGVGLGPRREGNGLRGLRERVEAAGCVLHIESPAGRSTDGGGSASVDPPAGTTIEVAG